jgi:hypothetical protein
VNVGREKEEEGASEIEKGKEKGGGGGGGGGGPSFFEIAVVGWRLAEDGDEEKEKEKGDALIRPHSSIEIP